MARTVIGVPTALSGQEAEAKLAGFLQGNGFKKLTRIGEELYGSNQGWLELDDSYYVKIRHSNGMLHLEVFRVHKGWERPADDMSSHKGRELLGRLQPLLMELGSRHAAEIPIKEKNTMAKFCFNCGAGLPEAARFCPGCGTQAVAAGTPRPAAPMPQPIPQPMPRPIPQPNLQPIPQPMPQPVYQPPQPQLTAKQAALRDAPFALNRPDQPWVVTVEGDSIVARWKWMDANFFAPHEVSNEVREYAFTVTLADNQTWRELDKSGDKAKNVGMSGGKLSFGSSSNTFTGKQNQKSFQLGVGQNNRTGQAGLVAFKFNTTPVKESIRAYLTSHGWKKAGLFG